MIEFGNPEVLPQTDPSKTAEAVRVGIKVNGAEKTFSLVLGDMLEVDADAITCPANKSFQYYGPGIQGVIARRAGIEIFEEVYKNAKRLSRGTDGVKYEGLLGPFRGLPAGYALESSAGKLDRFRYVVH